MIDKTSENLGQIPREFSLWSEFYLQIYPSNAVKKYRPELMIIYQEQRKLLKEGQVALAIIVQANVRLFEKGKKDHPANVIYLTTANAENHLKELLEISRQIGYLKNQDFLINDEEVYFSNLVANEMNSAFRILLPKSLSRDLEVYFTTIMVHRKHLPDKFLKNMFFPLLIHPDTDASMIVPSRYWSEDVLSAWKQ